MRKQPPWWAFVPIPVLPLIGLPWWSPLAYAAGFLAIFFVAVTCGARWRAFRHR